MHIVTHKSTELVAIYVVITHQVWNSKDELDQLLFQLRYLDQVFYLRYLDQLFNSAIGTSTT